MLLRIKSKQRSEKNNVGREQDKDPRPVRSAARKHMIDEATEDSESHAGTMWSQC